jgi:hypothetical protein
MTTPQKSDAGLAFSLPSKVTDQETDCDAPPDTGATETPGPTKSARAKSYGARSCRTPWRKRSIG